MRRSASKMDESSLLPLTSTSDNTLTKAPARLILASDNLQVFSLACMLAVSDIHVNEFNLSYFLFLSINILLCKYPKTKDV